MVTTRSVPRSPRLRRISAAAATLLLAVFSCVGPQVRSFAQGKRILVTGAGGRTGRLVIETLVASGRYDVKALVRSEKSKAALLKRLDMLNPNSVFVGDIEKTDSLKDAFKGAVTVIVVSSAVPKLKVWSLVPFFIGKLFRQKWKLRFGWKGGKPEQVDWLGQKNQFDVAKEAGTKHIILVGTMTGTQKESFLNSIGEGDGDQIVMWKRKAEVYLVNLCKEGTLDYTIIHAGGLADSPGGVDKLAVGVDDKLRELETTRRIPRADVAEACVQALETKTALGRSFDLSGSDDGQALGPDGLETLLETLKGANCDYSINPPP